MKRDFTIYVAKTKALISFAVTANLICVFVFAYAKNGSQLVKNKTPSIDFSAVASPTTPATPSTQVKRGLTSPDFPLDQKKNKPFLSPMAQITEVVPMEGATGGPILGSDGS